MELLRLVANDPKATAGSVRDPGRSTSVTGGRRGSRIDPPGLPKFERGAARPGSRLGFPSALDLIQYWG